MKYVKVPVGMDPDLRWDVQYPMEPDKTFQCGAIQDPGVGLVALVPISLRSEPGAYVAEEIVNALNAHDALQAVVEALVRADEMADEYESQEIFAEMAREVAENARAALALVEQDAPKEQDDA